MLVEVLLVDILSSLSQNKLAFYSSVLFHMIKNEPRMMSSAFAILIELLFRRIPSMNAGPVDLFVRFFSLFLSNFEYKWPWAHWGHVLETQADDSQRLFVSAVIERCVRLSYRQHMQTILPGEFHMLLPPNPVHIIRFRQDEQQGVSFHFSYLRYSDDVNIYVPFRTLAMKMEPL